MALATGLGPVHCPEPLSPFAPCWGGSGPLTTWAGRWVRGTAASGVLGARGSEVEVPPGLLPGLGNECLDPLYLLLLFLQLLRAQGSVRLQVNVPLGDEDFVWGGELWRDPGHCLHPPRASTPPSPPDSAHLLIDVHVIVLRLQLHLSKPGNFFPWRLIGLPTRLFCAQGRLQVGDIHFVDAAMTPHLGDGTSTAAGASRQPYLCRPRWPCLACPTWPPPHCFCSACPKPAHLQASGGKISLLSLVNTCHFPSYCVLCSPPVPHILHS